MEFIEICKGFDCKKGELYNCAVDNLVLTTLAYHLVKLSNSCGSDPKATGSVQSFFYFVIMITEGRTVAVLFLLFVAGTLAYSGEYLDNRYELTPPRFWVGFMFLTTSYSPPVPFYACVVDGYVFGVLTSPNFFVFCFSAPPLVSDAPSRLIHWRC